MKETIVITLIFISSVASLEAQIYTPGGAIQGTSGNNNVGIGTLNPSSLLTLRATDDNAVITLNRKGQWHTISSGLKLTTDDAGTDYWNFGMLPNGTNTLHLGTNGNSSISVLTNGKVGIGTTTPETLLNVNIGSGGSNGVAGIRVGGLGNYSSLEFGIDGDYDGMIRSYGNNLNYYAGHWKIKGVTASENHSHNWYTSKTGSADWSAVKMILNQEGNLGIGTSIPDAKLTVNGNIHAKEVKIDLGIPAPDYVFAGDYKLKSLREVEDYIKKNYHLPEIPSAKEFEKNGIMLAEMNMNLLKKVEELTLYMIEQNRRLEVQQKENKVQSKEIETLKKENETFKTLSERFSKIETQLK